MTSDRSRPETGAATRDHVSSTRVSENRDSDVAKERRRGRDRRRRPASHSRSRSSSSPAAGSVWARVAPGLAVSSRLRDLAGRNSIHIGSAMVVMGGWAAVANRAHGVIAASGAGLVQAAASALVTFSLKASLEAMSERLRGPLAFVVPPTVTCSVVLALLVAVHHLAGTRELWSTIAIPYAASSAYAWIYTALQVRRRDRS